jgi:hypothetical protein
MAIITLRILDGADRGKILDGLDTPITIGREEGNTIQLNDERISRFHLKIQEDHDKIVLTDLESTNGSRVNGEDTQLRILRFGDMITIGRSVVLYGSRAQIAGRLAALRGEDVDWDHILDEDEEQKLEDVISLDFELNWSSDLDIQSTFHVLEAPDIPDRLDAVQAAQLSELLEYLHIRCRKMLATVSVDDKEERVTLEQRQWQNLIDMQARLVVYIRAIGDPDANR